MNAAIVGKDFDGVYKGLIKSLFDVGVVSVSRKGKKLTELYDQIFLIEDPNQCMAVRREMSYDYLKNEFAFYMSGSDKLEDAVKCSPFWEKCTDDGETINSNYGKLIFHDKNKAGFTQFEHAVNCLKNSRGSKKAVMTLYDKENAYMSNDNPCTMYLRARIDEEHKLHLTAVMRSSDIYYGLPYDVPFFVFIQKCLIRQLSIFYPSLTLGTYTHMANSLHFYEYKRKELEKALEYAPTVEERQYAHDFYSNLVLKHAIAAHKLLQPDFMEVAWSISLYSGCYKKKVGCVFTLRDSSGNEHIISQGYGDISEFRDRIHCEPLYPEDGLYTCRRDEPEDVWYETGCPSVHAEHRALQRIFNDRRSVDFSKVTVYVTHGPCDACLKMLDFVGVKEVFYDIPYKTDYSHWPDMSVQQIPNPSNREEGKYGRANS